MTEQAAKDPYVRGEFPLTTRLDVKARNVVAPIQNDSSDSCQLQMLLIHLTWTNDCVVEDFQITGASTCLLERQEEK